MGTGGTDIVAARCQNDARIVCQHSGYFIHMTDKVLVIPLTFIKLKTKRMVRAQLQPAHSAATFDRRLDRITARAIFAASKRRNGTTQSNSDSPSPIPVTAMNRIVPVT